MLIKRDHVTNIHINSIYMIIINFSMLQLLGYWESIFWAQELYCIIVKIMIILLHHLCTWHKCIWTLTLSQCTLAGPVYTGMPLECHWLTQCTLGYHWATQRILAGYTGTPLEKLSWNSPHWNAAGETLTFEAYTGTPLEGLWQPTQAPTHILKDAE